MAARKVVLLLVKLESQSQAATGSDSRIIGNGHHMYLKPERTLCPQARISQSRVLKEASLPRMHASR